MYIMPNLQDPATVLLGKQGSAPHDVAKEIVRRYSYHNMTSKSFWNAIQTSGSLTRRIFLNGKQYLIPEQQMYRRICDLFLFYATCGQNENIIAAVKAECAEQ